MPTDLPRLRKVLGGPDTEWLVNRLRERIAGGRALTGSVRLIDPTPAERAAVDRLLGRRAAATGSISVPLDRLATMLADAGIHDGDLVSALTLLTGPVAVRADTVAAAEQAWSTAFTQGADLVSRSPALAAWWDRISRRGLVRRLASGDPHTAAALLADTVTVLDALPVERELLGVFAARTLGNAHRLDPDRPVTGLVVSALRALAELPDEVDRRTAWSSAGVIVDELSTRVLTLGLTADPGTTTGRAVNSWRAAGEPVVFTLRQLSSAATFFTPGSVVYLCENPTVLAAAADRLGSRCPPLVCTEGQPGTAVITLLDQLTATGAQLRYHGDFDWYGIAIANFLHRRYTWQPWLFTAADYAAAAPTAEPEPLRGPAKTARWDPALTTVMSRRAIQIEEEHVIADLLTDLATAPAGLRQR